MWLLSFITGTIGRWLIMGGVASAVVVGAYYAGKWECASEAHVAQLEATVAHLQAEIARRDARTEADNAAREADRDALERLEEANRILQNELQDPDRVCLDAPDTERLRRLWPSP